MGCEENNYSVLFHWSNGVIITTIFVIAIFIGMVFFVESIIIPKWLLWTKYLSYFLFAAIIIGALCLMPLRLSVDNYKITLNRMINSFNIPLNNIVEIIKIQKNEIDGSTKILGSDGAFGYIGRFKNEKLGNYTMYATELKNLILIRTSDNKTYIFSCKYSEDFIRNIKDKSNL